MCFHIGVVETRSFDVIPHDSICERSVAKVVGAPMFACRLGKRFLPKDSCRIPWLFLRAVSEGVFDIISFLKIDLCSCANKDLDIKSLAHGEVS